MDEETLPQSINGLEQISKHKQIEVYPTDYRAPTTKSDMLRC